MPDTAGVTHHLVLNGQGYMLHQSAHGLAYQRREAPYLVPRRADAVGRLALTRPGQDNGGFGQGVQTAFGQGGYARLHGCDARAGDGLRIATKLVSVTGLARQVNAWAEFNGTVYAATETGTALYVFKYNSTTNTFTENPAGGGAANRRLVAFANYLWVAARGGGVGTVDTTDTATAASGANAAGIVDLARSGTRLLGVTGAGATRAVRWFGVGNDAPPTAGWTTANEDGDPRETVNGLAALGETFYVGKADGLYELTLTTTPSASLSLAADHRACRDADNFKALVAFDGALYYTVRDRLYRFDGSSERDVSPPASVAGPTGEGVTRYVVKALAAGSGWLWALTESDETPRAIHLWAWRGAAGSS